MTRLGLVQSEWCGVCWGEGGWGNNGMGESGEVEAVNVDLVIGIQKVMKVSKRPEGIARMEGECW